MKRPHRRNPVALALSANAVLLLAILVVLLGRGRTSPVSAAYGDASLPPIAGGNGLYVMPCQLHPNVWGCYVLDANHQTLCVYEYRTGEQALMLTAARQIGYDLQLKNYNTFPAWYDIRKAVEDAANSERAREVVPQQAP